MRSRSVRWAMLAYVVLSLAAIVWLSFANAGARTFRETTLAAQVKLLSNTIHGAAQNLEAVPQAEDKTRLLVEAEASLAQAEILALSYEQTSGNKLPLPALPIAQIRAAREELARGNTLTPEMLNALAEIKADLDKTAAQLK